MTKLDKPIHRETSVIYQRRPVLVTVAPVGGSQDESLLAFRLKGKRTQYVVAVSVAYRWAAQIYAAREAAARRAARKMQIPWRKAKEQFLKDNSLPPYTPRKPAKSDSSTPAQLVGGPVA